MIFKKFILASAAILSIVVLSGCVKVPKEAPELSTELGKRIQALEDSNLTLLHRFFDLKRAEVDRFIQEEWVPTFAEEFFRNPEIQQAWNTIVAENNPKERLAFLLHVAPKIQARINMKRTEMIEPLNQIERRIEEPLRSEYSQAKAVNDTLTRFLASASKVSASRDRYLSKIGITDAKVGTTIDKVNDVVGGLLATEKQAEELAKQTKDYIDKLKAIEDQIGN